MTPETPEQAKIRRKKTLMRYVAAAGFALTGTAAWIGTQLVGSTDTKVVAVDETAVPPILVGAVVTFAALLLKAMYGSEGYADKMREEEGFKAAQRIDEEYSE